MPRAPGSTSRRARSQVAEAGVAVAERNLEDTVVRAPFAGIVTVKAAQEGEMVSPISAGGGYTRTGVGTIVDMESLEVEVDVSENFINRVHAGQRATAKLNAYPDWEIPAHVIAIIPTADRAKATVKVRVGFDSTATAILPEMGVRVAFLESANGATPAQTSVGSRALRGASRRPCRPTATSASSIVVNDGAVETPQREARHARRDGQIVLSGLTSGARIAVGDLVPARRRSEGSNRQLASGSRSGRTKESVMSASGFDQERGEGLRARQAARRSAARHSTSTWRRANSSR